MYTYRMLHRSEGGIDFFFLKTLTVIIPQTIWKGLGWGFFSSPRKRHYLQRMWKENLLIYLNTNANFSCT